MISSTLAFRQRELELELNPRELCRRLRRRCGVTLLLDGQGGFGNGWDAGPLLAIDPRCVLELGGEITGDEHALSRLERIVSRRRRNGGSAQTGVAALLSYEALDGAPPRTAPDHGPPSMAVFEVDRSLRFVDPTRAIYSERRGDRGSGLEEELVRLADGDQAAAPGGRQPSVVGRLRTSLPFEAYLAAVRTIQAHIVAGNIYQANLCRHFSGEFRGDPFDYYEELERATPAPRSAFVETPRYAVASVSPEIFLRADRSGEIQTWPIKGTRARRPSSGDDRQAARELLVSAKDRAELLMIVDLERNDLGRVCRTGSISVPRLAQLRSFAAVHHLVACVQGRLREDAGIEAVLRATFPGGSISGAPKIRARQILTSIEPVRRGLFTGCLLWFGDDGTMDSSILIRTVIFANGAADVGAGSGIVADSDPEQEWQETIAKARAPLAAFGREAEEAE